MTLANETTSPAASLARATRKPRGSADGVWNEMLTLRDKFRWSQREIAQLLDVSDAMVSYVMKQPGLYILNDKTESQIVRELFAPVLEDNSEEA
jgi:hypothetical protein